MNYSLDADNFSVAELGTMKLYVTSYEVSRDRRYNFLNQSEVGVYLADNGPYPSYLKLKGFILKSECEYPCVIFNEHMEYNTRYFLNFDGMYFNAARLKTYSIVTENNSPVIKCEVILCCDSYIIRQEDREEQTNQT